MQVVMVEVVTLPIMLEVVEVEVEVQLLPLTTSLNFALVLVEVEVAMVRFIRFSILEELEEVVVASSTLPPTQSVIVEIY